MWFWTVSSVVNKCTRSKPRHFLFAPIYFIKYIAVVYFSTNKKPARSVIIVHCAVSSALCITLYIVCCVFMCKCVHCVLFWLKCSSIGGSCSPFNLYCLSLPPLTIRSSTNFSFKYISTLPKIRFQYLVEKVFRFDC